MSYRASPDAQFLQFMSSLASLAGDEARKAKLLYIRNELAGYEERVDDSRTFGFVQLAFAVIPLFWPVLLAQRHGMVTGARTHRQRIKNALDIWRTDLGDDAVLLEADLERLAARAPRLLPFLKPKATHQLPSGR